MENFKYEVIKVCKQSGARVGRFTTPEPSMYDEKVTPSCVILRIFESEKT